MKKAKGLRSDSAVRIFSALGDSTRFKLFNILASKEKICVSEIASEVGISTAGASQQLKVLEGAGVIKRQRMGQKVCYTLSESKEIQKIVEAVNK